MLRRDDVQVRMEIDGKQAISELGKQELAAYEYRQEIKQIKEEQSVLEKESKKLDKIRERYEKLALRIKELDEAGKSNTKTYKQTLEQFSKVSKELHSAEKATKDLAASQARYNEASGKLDQTKGKIARLREQMGLAGMTMRQLRKYQSDLTREMDVGTTRGTAKYEQLKAKLKEVNAAIAQQRSEVNGTSSAWAKIKTEISKFGMLALGYLGAQEIIGQVGNMVKGAAELSDTLSDVQKTTGLANTEVKDLAKTFGTWNTRTARKELLGMAEIAGRLGIQGKKDIEGFVKAADMVNVALGDSLGDVETVMRELGKLTSTYNIKEAYGIEESMLRVGSALNELGMASTANEGNIVDFTKRLGGIAPLAKITIQDIMGLGATLDSLGQTSEVSSTALSKLFINMAKNASTYAKFAKMEVNDFVELMNKDANEAFLRVLEGVKDNSNGITELASSLGDLGEDGGRVVGVLGTLANNIKLLRDQQKISNQAFEEGTSIWEEFQVKNENLAAAIAKVQKWVNKAFVNNAFVSFLDKSVGRLADWVTGIERVSLEMEKERMQLNKLYAQTITTNTGTDERIKLINEMKSLFPGHLKDIDAETVSNQELAAAVSSVNKQLINRIILQQQDDRIAEHNRKVAMQRKEIFDQEDAVRATAIKMAEKYNFQLAEGVTAVEQFRDAWKKASEAQSQAQRMARGRIFNDVSNFGFEIKELEVMMGSLAAMERFNDNLVDEKGLLMKRLGIGQDEPKNSQPTEPTSKTTDFLSEEEKAAIKAAEEKYQALIQRFKDFQSEISTLERDAEISRMDKDSQEIARIEEKFQTLRDKALEYYNQGAIDKQTYDDTIAAVDALQEEQVLAKIAEQGQKIKDARQQVAEEIESATMDEHERQVKAAEARFDELIQQAREYGLSTVEIERAKLETIARLNADHQKRMADQTARTNQERLQDEIQVKSALVDIHMEYANIVGAAIDLVGNKSGKLTAFQKILALTQIGIDTAAAIMKAEIIALQAASVGGPAAPFIYKATKLSVLGSILTAAARAKNILFDSQDPTWAGGDSATSGEGPVQSRRGIAQPKNSYYYGGPTGSGLGFGDQYGEYAGYVHQREYVIPEAVRQTPIVKMQIEPMLEALRMRWMGRGFYTGGPTEAAAVPALPSVPAGTSDNESKALLREIRDIVKQWPKTIRGQWVYRDWEEMHDEMRDIENRYKR